MRPLLRRLWLGVRTALELAVPRPDLDRFLEWAGFFRFKSGFLKARRRLPDGSELVYRLDEERIVREIYDDGAYDQGRIADGDTVVDVGANIGVFTLKAARQTPKGRVVAVEPAPLNLELLRENVARNRLANAVILDCALSDHEGQGQLYSRGDYALYSLHLKADLSTPVRVSTLDKLFQEQGIRACQLLKIDVEGEELAVLRGGAQALRVTQQVITEVTNIEDYPRLCRELLTQAGFSCTVATESPGGLLLIARRP
jgi:FkbM family methyltransferase